jgi:uncharacterized protein YkwD
MKLFSLTGLLLAASVACNPNGTNPPPVSTTGGSGAVCGDGVCDASLGESSASCPADCAQNPPPSNPPPASWPSAWAQEESQMLVLVNQARARGANCGGTVYGPANPVAMDAALQQAARSHSQDMATHNYFQHDSLDGKTPWDRMAQAGYTAQPRSENIAAGNATAQDTVTQWLNSPGHCVNLMDPTATEMGVGYAFDANSTYQHYWTQDFGIR